MSLASPSTNLPAAIAGAASSHRLEARPAGVSIHLDVLLADGIGPAAERLRRELCARLSEPGDVAVRVLGLACTDPVQAFAAACECVARAAADAGSRAAEVTLAVDAHDIAPADAWSIRSARLGRGPLYFVGTDARLESDDVLRQLWSLRSEHWLGAAFWPLVRSPTPLLDNEVGDDLVPGPALQSPAGAAWVWVRLNVSACVHNGESVDTCLDDMLRRALCAADAIHRHARWPTAALRHDAWLNRRVAVELTHIGEWVTACGLSAGKLSTLAAVDDLIGHASQTLTALSRGMCCGQALPAIEARDPCRRLADDSLKEAWQERWRFALERAGIGHRNLLAISPWSLFAATADVRGFNLIPALRHADVCTFRRDVQIDHWNVDEYREFHRRAWAVMRQNARPSLVAEEL